MRSQGQSSEMKWWGRWLGVGGMAFSVLVGLSACQTTPLISGGMERVEQYKVDPKLPACVGEASRDCVVLVTFNANPWVDVFLDSQYVGRTPLENVRVKPKTYKMRLVNNSISLDYSAQKEILVPPGGERITLDFQVSK